MWDFIYWDTPWEIVCWCRGHNFPLVHFTALFLISTGCAGQIGQTLTPNWMTTMSRNAWKGCSASTRLQNSPLHLQIKENLLPCTCCITWAVQRHWRWAFRWSANSGETRIHAEQWIFGHGNDLVVCSFVTVFASSAFQPTWMLSESFGHQPRIADR